MFWQKQADLKKKKKKQASNEAISCLSFFWETFLNRYFFPSLQHISGVVSKQMCPAGRHL